MSSILDKLVEEMGKSELDEQVRKLCDMIEKEENPTKEVDEDLHLGPVGPNVFLSLEISKVKEQSRSYWFISTFVTLEREASEEYIIRHWTRKTKLIDNKYERQPLKLVKSWPVKKHDKPQRILKEFVEILQYLKGE